MRALAIMYAEEQYRAWGDLLHSVKTGQSAFDNMFGTDYFAYLAGHPESDRVFNQAMTGWTNQLVGGVVDAYDFSGFKTVVDVGAVMAPCWPRSFNATPAFRAFFSTNPRSLKRHQMNYKPPGSRTGARWDDERGIEILKQCRRAMQQDGRLLVVELVLPEGQEPFFGKWLDLHMLVLLGARERTATEYNALFHASGFDLTKVSAMPSGPSVVEAVPV